MVSWFFLNAEPCADASIHDGGKRLWGHNHHHRAIAAAATAAGKIIPTIARCWFARFGAVERDLARARLSCGTSGGRCSLAGIAAPCHPTTASDLKESQQPSFPSRPRLRQQVVFMWHTKCISFIKLQICNAWQV